MYQNQFINFTKGLAVLVVFILHFSLKYAPLHSDKILSPFAFTPAWTGVWIFFIISGYLIGKGFWSGKYKVETLKDFGHFYVKRAFRILPVYFLIVLIDMFFINTNMYFNGSETLSRVFTFRLRNPYGNNMIGNLWFVCTILQLYLITPFVYKVIKPLKSATKLVKWLCLSGLIIFYFVLRQYLWLKNVPWDSVVLSNSICNIDLYFGGFIFSIFCLDKQDTKQKRILRPLSFCLLIGFLVLNTILMWLSGFGFMSFKFVKIVCPTVILLIMFLCLYAHDVEAQYKGLGENIKRRMLKILKNPLLLINYLGIISFGFYCCHCQIIDKVCKLNNSSLLYSQAFGLSFIFTLAWAVIIYIFVEKRKFL